VSTKRTTRVHVEILDEQPAFSLREICEVCSVHADRIVEMVDEGIACPHGAGIHVWRFSGRDVVRIRAALRLERDLRVNLPGAALVLDLLDELQSMRNRGGD
jgi:chaperone modulatory protein CbpM